MRNLALGAVIGFAVAVVGLSLLSRDPNSAAPVNAAPSSSGGGANPARDPGNRPMPVLRLAPEARQQVLQQAVRNERFPRLAGATGVEGVADAGPTRDAGL